MVVEPLMNRHKSSTWICYLCPKTFAKPHRLAWHLANIHFRDALVTINILGLTSAEIFARFIRFALLDVLQTVIRFIDKSVG